MNRSPNRHHAWYWLAPVISGCSLLLVDAADRQAVAQEELRPVPAKTREAEDPSPAYRNNIRRRPIDLVAQIDAADDKTAPPVRREQDVAVAAAKTLKAPEFLPRLSDNAEKILKALDESTEVSFVDSPLSEAIGILKDLHNIEIWLDKETLTAEGVATDTPVNLSLSGVRVRSALHLMLEPIGLTYIVEDEVLKVTTKEAASKVLITRTYPVGDLFDSYDEASELIDVIRNGVGIPIDEKTAKPAGMPTAQSTGLKTLTATIGGPSPSTSNGTAEKKDRESIAVSIKARAVVVRQTHAVHDQLQQLLHDLREAKTLVPVRSASEFGGLRSRAPYRTSPQLDEFSPGSDAGPYSPREDDASLNLDPPNPSQPPLPKTKQLR